VRGCAVGMGVFVTAVESEYTALLSLGYGNLLGGGRG